MNIEKVRDQVEEQFRLNHMNTDESLGVCATEAAKHVIGNLTVNQVIALTYHLEFGPIPELIVHALELAIQELSDCESLLQ